MAHNNKIYNNKISYRLAISAIAIFIVLFYLVVLSYRVRCESADSIIFIPKGATLTKVADILYDNNCLSNLYKPNYQRKSAKQRVY